MAQNQARVATVSQSVSSITEAGFNFLEIIGSKPSQENEYAAVKHANPNVFIFGKMDFYNTI